MASSIDILPETALLLELCLTPLSPRSRQNAASLILQPLDWNRVFHQASVWQVEPVAMSNLHSLMPVDSPVAELAKTRARDARAISLARTLIMNDLVSRFGDAGIATIVIKGPATGVTAYDDPSLRTFSDIDLLVRREDLAAASTLIRGLGYEAEYARDGERDLIQREHALEFSSSNAKVELHASLLSRYLQVPFDSGDIWATSRTVTCAGRTIGVLAADLEFLFLCVHGTKHQWLELRWLADVAQLATRLSSAEALSVVQRADVLRVRKILALSLRLCCELFGITIGPELTTAMQGIDTRRMANIVTQMSGVRHGRPGFMRFLRKVHPGLPALAFWVATREQMGDRIRSFGELLLGPSSTGETH